VNQKTKYKPDKELSKSKLEEDIKNMKEFEQRLDSERSEELLKVAKDFVGWVLLALFAFLMALGSFIIGLVAIFDKRLTLLILCIIASLVAISILRWSTRNLLSVIREANK